MKNLLNNSRIILRILMGCVFILSAILKLISIDNVEIYIYSFHFCSFTLAAVGARCLIATEFVIGIFLLLKAQYRLAWWLATLMTTGFTLFLIYVVLFRNDANCHCFGDLIPIEPLHSIYKNIVFLAIMLFIYPQTAQRLAFSRRRNDSGKCCLGCYITEEPYSNKFKIWLLGICGGGSMLVLFGLFPTNTLYSAIFSNDKLVNTTVYNRAYTDSSFFLTLSNVDYIAANDTVTFSTDTARLDLDEGSYLIAVISSGCKYCRHSCELIHNIFEHNKLDKTKMKFLVWGNTPSIARFIRETKTWEYEFRQISPYLAIDIVFGNFPTFVLVKDGSVVEAFNYRGINEQKIKAFLE